jgi:predicted metal-dependent enzyme (double-stranded beta helix superfamily)
MIVDKIWKLTNVVLRGLDLPSVLTHRDQTQNFDYFLFLRGLDTLSVQHLIPCPSLPTINHVHKWSLVITVLLISTRFDHSNV